MIAVALFAGVWWDSNQAFAAVAEADSSEELSETKIDIPINFDTEFSDNSIIVALDKYTSGVNKQQDPDIFGDFPKKSVTDLTYITGNISDKKYLNEDEFRQMFRIELPVASQENVLAALEKAKKAKGVLWAKPDYIEGIAVPTNTGPIEGRIINQNYWGLGEDYGIQAEKAWDLLEESSSDLETVRVAVIDTGIAEHSDLVGKVEQGYDFYNNNSVTTDDPNGHGTHVAGIIAASGEAIGVYEKVSLIPLQVVYWDTDEEDYYFSWIAVLQAINYAISEDIPIINYSGGGPTDRDELKLAISNYGGLFITSAGNGFQEEENGPYIGRSIDIGSGYEHYPAGYIHENIIAVGNMDSKGVRTSDSNYGARAVDIFAPGAYIKSTYPYDLSEDGYAYLSGTSMATPFVTGVAAMLLSYDGTLTSAEIKDAILSSAVDTSSLNGLCLTGGRLNAYRALEYIIEGQTSTYTVYFNEGQTLPSRPVSGASSSKVYTHGMPESLSVGNKFSITGYEVIEWSTKEATFTLGVGTNTDPEYLVDMAVGGVTFDSSITLYAVWRPREWSVGIETDGTMSSLQHPKMYYDGDPITISAANVSGMEFVEWRKYYNNSSGYTVFSTSKTITLHPNDYLPDRFPANTPIFYLIAVFQHIETGENPDEGTCIAEGTLITLADGSQKAVEDLTGDEMLLVWDLYTGTFGSAPILCIDSDPVGQYQVIQLSFSDGTAVDVISEHGFFDIDLNKYVYLDEYAAEYIGHAFWKQGENGMTAVTLVDVEISTEVTVAYSPVTYGHLCYYVNGMLSMPGGIGGLFNIFEIDAETMKYDAEAMAADIAQYGLYTYEELNALVPVPEVMFDAVNGQYLKVAVGKGIVTLEEIGELVERYSDLFA